MFYDNLLSLRKLSNHIQMEQPKNGFQCFVIFQSGLLYISPGRKYRLQNTQRYLHICLYETSIFCGVLSPCGSHTFTMQSRGNCVIWNQQHKGYKSKPTTYQLSNCDGLLNLSDFKFLLITKLGLLEMTGDCTQDLTQTMQAFCH